MAASTTQSNATWGLDRSDQRSLPPSTTFSYTRTGAGVTAYIIDTGIRTTHSEFGGRTATGHSANPLLALFGADSTAMGPTWRERSEEPPTAWPKAYV